jgi:hypothetical protein
VCRHRIIEETPCLDSRGGVNSSRSGGGGKGGDSVSIASSRLNTSPVLSRGANSWWTDYYRLPERTMRRR